MEIIGRVTGDASVRTLSDERKVVNFSVAVSDSYKARNGEQVTQTEFFDCSYWISAGIAPYLTKGKLVELSGRVSARAWVNEQGTAKAGLNFHTSKIKLHGATTTPEPKDKKGNRITADSVEAKGTIVKGKKQEDDLPF